jgi:hypothetical protein
MTLKTIGALSPNKKALGSQSASRLDLKSNRWLSGYRKILAPPGPVKQMSHFPIRPEPVLLLLKQPALSVLPAMTRPRWGFSGRSALNNQIEMRVPAAH